VTAHFLGSSSPLTFSLFHMTHAHFASSTLSSLAPIFARCSGVYLPAQQSSQMAFFPGVMTIFSVIFRHALHFLRLVTARVTRGGGVRGVGGTAAFA
jgi:hypothetical protein